jgi:hypothetical protein
MPTIHSIYPSLHQPSSSFIFSCQLGSTYRKSSAAPGSSALLPIAPVRRRVSLSPFFQLCFRNLSYILFHGSVPPRRALPHIPTLRVDVYPLFAFVIFLPLGTLPLAASNDTYLMPKALYFNLFLASSVRAMHHKRMR